MKRPLQIAVDGPAGSGKGTAASMLGKVLKLPVLDTGLLYRFVAWRAMESRVDLNNTDAFLSFVSLALKTMSWRTEGVFFDGKDCTSLLRGEDVGAVASKVASMPAVREALLQMQQTLAIQGCVMDGRDIGTVVLPEAQVKFFLTASLRERGRRRWLQLTPLAQRKQSLEQMIKEVALRDQRDSERTLAPLKQAEDAIVIDSTTLRQDEVVDRMLRVLKRRDLIELDEYR
ncbi:MAG: (d)CMP kinase [Mariprofundaceae bacterium]|nr:(d)CMP kinase [Mariprofundaceae bacterium]